MVEMTWERRQQRLRKRGDSDCSEGIRWGQLARGDGSGRDGAVRRPKWDSRLERGDWGRSWLASRLEIAEAVGVATKQQRLPPGRREPKVDTSRVAEQGSVAEMAVEDYSCSLGWRKWWTVVREQQRERGLTRGGGDSGRHLVLMVRGGRKSLGHKEESAVVMAACI
ncbi:hypothetical protein AMTR_s00112p00112200 [Amborella trichopoda]|uniref:Uncharacterized protein n=1 Tax=Amborella trichopoda TaxID=13333 RepID=W1NSN0_AMBTC|nr:hypothetical protein AMTR_s00112p00112200 [Amborella trichopoda]